MQKASTNANIEDGTCRYFFAHENNTVIESPKILFTQYDVANLKKNAEIAYCCSLHKKKIER